ncbi:MAG TPA: hypothetical protein VMU77_03345 [Acidimicrobiales bacterium]|nr:hypothetical protein [Acidimicrobiales bacterium]
MTTRLCGKFSCDIGVVTLHLTASFADSRKIVTLQSTALWNAWLIARIIVVA